MSEAEPPVDLDFGPVAELSGEDLVEQHRTLGMLFWQNGYQPHVIDWHETVADRTRETWREIKSRADTDEPACPMCGGRDWGQVPGNPIECGECGYETSRRDERAVHEAWDAMFDEVDR